MGNYTDEQAGNMRGLVKLMRRNLELTEQLCVTMAEELDFVNTFINLEREALGDSFILSTSIDAAIHLDQEILPSMMIQIPVENSVKHALRGKEESGICGLPQIVGKAVFASGLRITAAVTIRRAGTEALVQV